MARHFFVVNTPDFGEVSMCLAFDADTNETFYDMHEGKYGSDGLWLGEYHRELDDDDITEEDIAAISDQIYENDLF